MKNSDGYSSALNMIVNSTEQFVFANLYPTIFDKATILFVQLDQEACFYNATKNCFRFKKFR